ncbi:Alpha-ketoglutarate-dependent dioxygenase abh1 [Cyphellophora attinorum]|uniref:mRNA N(6)-methyladenine demethylase n=1 Tax=Cyphellophora attinorum TaxID=1664694 RepID=A0A0N1HLB4_9EURO|nr:Alpha-ketoglutarate-dependent dioxygenase abh1 [Phialophora attinorum]KPI37756.1 Alpha-ketoglutarate-dependent dioxygenase abh1 [Phialophora attinorum]
MANTVDTSDAYSKPPDALKVRFKFWQKASIANIETSADITESKPSHDTYDVCSGSNGDMEVTPAMVSYATQRAFEVEDFPGLIIYPDMLPPSLQVGLLNRLLHRDLSNPEHMTNVHLFHHMQYPDTVGPETAKVGSFFGMDPTHELLPKDTAVHKPLSIERLLSRKLRWMTLGGQYDWTNKKYPDEVPPAFPADIAQLLRTVFPDVDAQAAIVNLYTPGDILAVHRDVAEECDRGLISISIGCDALFLVGNEDGTKHATLRLRSGDAVVMSGTSRYAWHGVPKILPNTCPDYLREWPEEYPRWKGWMTSKRINLNVRQMHE